MQAKLMEMSDLSKLIGSIGRQRVEFDVALQQAACQVIGQSIVHSNITPANQLLDVIGTHLKAVVVAHLEKFGNMAWSREDKRMKFHRVKPAEAWTEEYAATVINTLWFKAKKEPMPKTVYDVADEADRFLERMLKAGKKGVELKHPELLQRLTETYNRYQAETYLKATAVQTTAPTEADVQEARATGTDGALAPEKLEQLRQKFGGRPEPVKQ